MILSIHYHLIQRETPQIVANCLFNFYFTQIKNRPRRCNARDGHRGSKLEKAYCPPIITRNMEELQCQENQIPAPHRDREPSASGQMESGRPALSLVMIPAIRKSVYAKTQKEVRQKLAQAVAAVDNKAYREPCKMTLGEWLDIWTQDYLGGVKTSTAYLYKKNVELYIVPHLGNIKLEALNTHTVQRFYNQLVSPTDPAVNPLSGKTVKNIHGVFHKAMQQAVLIGYLRVNPTDACTLPRVIKKEMHPLEEDQVTAFLKEVQGSPHEYLYKIALFTGLREGEILGLGWDHIDLENGVLTVKRQLRKEQKKGGQYYFSPPKNNRARSISLAPSVVLLFRLQKLAQNSMRMEAGDAWQENGLVFSNQTGGYLSYRTVYDCFKRIVKKIGSQATRFHDLRHTYAVACIKSGDDIKTVQENLGHATAAFTLDVYGHVTKQMKQDSALRMEQFIQSVSIG